MEGEDVFKQNCVTVAVRWNKKIGLTLPKSFEKNIMNQINKYRLINTKVKVVSPAYVGLSISGDIVTDSSYREKDKLIEKAIKDFIDDINCELGTTLHFGDLFGMIDCLKYVSRLNKLRIVPIGNVGYKNVSDDIVIPPNGVYYIHSMSFNYSLGSKVRLFPLYKTVVSGISSEMNVRKEFLNRWMRPGDEQYTNIPALISPGSPDYMDYVMHWSTETNIHKVPKFADSVWDMYDKSDLRVVSGNYLRLSALTLRYRLNSEQIAKTPFKSLQFAFSTSNLFTIASKDLKGQDPSQANNEKAVLSIRPAYTFSIDVSF